MSIKHYGLAITFLSIVFLSPIAAFNWLVDPYYIMGAPIIEGLNAHKSSFFFHLEKTKTYAFLNSDADSLILGTSRAGMAIAPKFSSNFSAALIIALYEI